MTKLTQQKIEKERASFEKWVCEFYEDNILELWIDERNCYQEFCVHMSYQAWLARAELAKGGE